MGLDAKHPKNPKVLGVSETRYPTILMVYHQFPHPYGSKHLLRRYLTPQIIPQTLPKKVLGSTGH
jgi:hypothetical protein